MKINLRYLQLSYLLKRFPERVVWGSYVLVNGFLTIAILATIAMFLKIPFIFPSLGPTAFTLFFKPGLASSSPRNVLWGHAIGILCGYFALLITGQQDSPAIIIAGINNARVIAAALSMASTGAMMILFDVPHAPAVATTLIISLGIITQPWHLLCIELAVGALVIQAIVINRLAGLRHPRLF